MLSLKVWSLDWALLHMYTQLKKIEQYYCTITALLHYQLDQLIKTYKHAIVLNIVTVNFLQCYKQISKQ